MSKTIVQNQLHPPLPKKKHVDKAGNDKRKVYFKSGNATILLCNHLTENAYKVLYNSLDELCTKLGSKLEGKLIWTH